MFGGKVLSWYNFLVSELVRSEVARFCIATTCTTCLIAWSSKCILPKLMIGRVQLFDLNSIKLPWKLFLHEFAAEIASAALRKAKYYD